MPSLFILLWFTWALVYWILGGVFFSIIAILRVGRVRRTWFGCSFTLSSFVVGMLAAWAGMHFSRNQVSHCLQDQTLHRFQEWMARFSCGIVEHIGAFLIGFVLLIGLGAVLMFTFTSADKNWIEKREQNNP